MRLRLDVFDKLTKARGAKTHVDRARLAGVDRSSLYRYRSGQFAPSLDVATRIAERLGTTVDGLFERDPS